MVDPRAERPRTGRLVALLLLIPVTAVALFVLLFPLATCPQRVHASRPGGAWGKYACFRCEDRGRISLLNRWRDGGDSFHPWEGMEISAVSTIGFVKTPSQAVLDRIGLRPGVPMTGRLDRRAYVTLMTSGNYEDVQVTVTRDLTKPGRVAVELSVAER